ncbi:MAG: DEAD/DEAH box helicase [Clostridia bacterium]|nr:DEAD/DEAH box helicase [Clostridia bacterium]
MDKSEYRAFKQLINTFRYKDYTDKEEKQVNAHTIKLEPKLIYNSYTKSLKIEFKIGNKNTYILKDLTEFYDHMIKEEYFQYGSKLSFKHTKDVFEPNSVGLLEFVMKYAEIIKYANESSKEYAYYGTQLSDRYITISNTGIDDLFKVLKNTNIQFQVNGKESTLYFEDCSPDIKFHVEEAGEEYKIYPNIDIYEYELIKGKEYTYFLTKNTLYRCSKEFTENELKVVEVFRKNFEPEIKFYKEDIPTLFSLVFPKIKKSMEIDKLNQDEILKYIPEDLYVKVYLDYDFRNHITADIKFVYGDFEFNPLAEGKIDIARDIAKEDEVLELFRKVGFMLDVRNSRLILVEDDLIYNFLSIEVEEFMQKFEVLATDNFKQKEIKGPKIGNVGVRIENNLLQVDLSNINFDISELREIMKQYKLKKKYHRLRDGSFLQLEENETMDFIDGITEQIDVDFSQIEKGELKFPIYRTMYLDRLLKNIKTTEVLKEDSYKSLIRKIEEKENNFTNLPAGLNASLRTYQKVGFEWLKVLEEYNFGGILADDMGLGKTIQLIAVILSYIQTESNPKPSIVICPSSLTLNWQNEINKFAPSIKSIVIRGGLTERKKQINSIKDYNVVITSYDLLKRDIEFYEQSNYQFKYIIADEAQYIKNNNTQNAKAIKHINGETRYALTGTPIENSLSELWSIFDFILPGYLFNYKKFKENFEIPITRDDDQDKMKKLKMLIEPFILRRIKSEVLTELPDKTISILNNEMQEEQEMIYMSYLQNAKQEAINEINANGFEKSQIKILALLMRLRQICCHPSLFIDNYKGESSKLNQCIELIKDAVESGHKILLFSGYTGMFDIIEKELKKENINYFKLTGSTKVGERIKLVDEFNENEEIKVFLISLKAGGTGLNLTGADMVIHYDPWWNLSAENQATDRTYRIGQKRNVQVYKLITKNSIEEKIYELQQRKAKLIDNMLSTNETFINKLSREDIMELFG